MSLEVEIALVFDVTDQEGEVGEVRTDERLVLSEEEFDVFMDVNSSDGDRFPDDIEQVIDDIKNNAVGAVSAQKGQILTVESVRFFLPEENFLN